MDLTKIEIDESSHTTPEQMALGKGCVMEWAGVFWLTSHGWKFEDAWKRLTDYPVCTDRTVALLAQLVNDSLPNDERQRLANFIPRLVRANTPLDVRIALPMSWDYVIAAVKRIVNDEKVQEFINNPARQDVQDNFSGLGETWAFRIGMLEIERSCPNQDPNQIEQYRDWLCEAIWLASVLKLDFVALLDELLDLFDKVKADHGALHEGPAVPPTLEELEESELELAEFAGSAI